MRPELRRPDICASMTCALRQTYYGTGRNICLVRSHFRTSDNTLPFLRRRAAEHASAFRLSADMNRSNNISRCCTGSACVRTSCNSEACRSIESAGPPDVRMTKTHPPSAVILIGNIRTKYRLSALWPPFVSVYHPAQTLPGGIHPLHRYFSIRVLTGLHRITPF